MKPMVNMKSLFLSAFVILATTLLISCSESSDTPSSKDKKDSTLLIYAVATNSLSGNLVSDKNEMLQGASNVDLERNNILIFETQYGYNDNNKKTGDVKLIKLVKSNGADAYVWEVVKDYTDDVASLDPQRMMEVIDYVTQNFPSKKYSLVLWSHSTGSQPSAINNIGISTQDISEVNYTASLPTIGWFGQDLSVDYDEYKYMNIDVLAKTLPDNFFDYIWFDSCYMSNIESIYQLRNKCNTYVAYPTEVLDSGLPYQYVLQYIVGERENLVEAAKVFYNYYSDSFGTVAVVDMNKIKILADYCKSLFNHIPISSSTLVKFSRYTTGPFYDLGDYVKAMAVANGSPITEKEWNEILNQCVLYKATTDGSLLRLSLNPETYSGISTHLYSFEGSDTETESYYKSLDWYQDVF